MAEQIPAFPKDMDVTEMNILRVSQTKPATSYSDIGECRHYYRKNQTMLLLYPDSPDWIDVPAKPEAP